MNKLRDTLLKVRNKVAQTNPEIATDINEAVLDMTPNTNPNIESFARPKPQVSVIDNEGTVHSFSVEIKSSKNGPIRDTQLMSRILKAVEGEDTVSEMSSSDMPKFEVVSFKYERREDKKTSK